MPGSIQSIERAAAVLRLLASTERPLALAELATALDLPRPTVHGIVRTLCDVEFVVQESAGARYQLAESLHGLGGGGLDPHDLRACAMNWADSLAGSTGLAVLVGTVAQGAAQVVHHVFRPDGSPQRLRIGEQLPLHATALGKCLLAFAPVATPRPQDLELSRWTGRTCLTADALDGHLAAARQCGWASEVGRVPGRHRRRRGPAAGQRWRGGRGLGGHRAGRGSVRDRGKAAPPLRRATRRDGPRDLRIPAGGLEPHRGQGRAMTERVVAAIDQGTTSTRCLLFNRSGRMLAVAQLEQRQHFPAPGLVEQDATEIWRNVRKIVPAALRHAGLTPEHLVALGIANQRETTVIWNRHTGRPLARSITWQDTRTDGIVNRLVADGHAETIEQICGLAPATYFAGPRLRWLLDHVPGARAGAEAGDVLFGTMESWLIWQLTGRHVTDVTNASRTMLMDLDTLEWSPPLLKILDVPERMLPAIRPNAEVYGVCTSVLPGVPVAGALGDQQAALVGQACFAPGEVKCTYGTGAFLLMNTGDRPAASAHGLIPTVGYQFGDRPVYALEGAIAMTGSLVQWFRDSLGMIGTAAQIETLARTVPDNGGCYIVPAFSGLYSPRWHPDARGVMVGLTSYIDRGHLARAVLEATGWQTREVVDAMNADSGAAGDPAQGGRRDDGQPPAHAVRRRRAGRAGGAAARVRGGVARRGLRGRAGRRLLVGPGGAARPTGTGPRPGSRPWTRRAARAERANWLPRGRPQLRLGPDPHRGLTPDRAWISWRPGGPDRRPRSSTAASSAGPPRPAGPRPARRARRSPRPPRWPGTPNSPAPSTSWCRSPTITTGSPARVQRQPLQHRADHGRLADPARDVVRPADQREVLARVAARRRSGGPVCSGFEVATASRSPAARSSSSRAGTPGKSGVWVAATRSYGVAVGDDGGRGLLAGSGPSAGNASSNGGPTHGRSWSGWNPRPAHAGQRGGQVLGDQGGRVDEGAVQVEQRGAPSAVRRHRSTDRYVSCRAAAASKCSA